MHTHRTTRAQTRPDTDMDRTPTRPCARTLFPWTDSTNPACGHLQGLGHGAAAAAVAAAADDDDDGFHTAEDGARWGSLLAVCCPPGALPCMHTCCRSVNARSFLSRLHFRCSAAEWRDMFGALDIGADVGGQKCVRRIVRGLGVGLDRVLLRELYWDGTVAQKLETYWSTTVGTSVNLEDWRQPGFDFTTPLHAEPSFNELVWGGGTHGLVRRFIEWFLGEQIVPPFDGCPLWVPSPERVRIPARCRCACARSVWPTLRLCCACPAEIARWHVYLRHA